MRKLREYCSLWSWDVGFIDPSTELAESIIQFYNYVFVFITLVIILVWVLIGVLLYNFTYKGLDFSQMFILRKDIEGIRKKLYYLNLYISFLLNNRGNIWKNLQMYRVKEINSWYSWWRKGEFLNASDIMEFRKLEFRWSMLPVVILLTIMGPSFSILYALDPTYDPVLTIRVVGHQWYWSYEYKNKIVWVREEALMLDQNRIWNHIFKNKLTFFFDSVIIQDEDLKEGTHRLLEVDNRTVVPIGTPIRFLITSTDVIHCWAIPSLGIKIDSTPGRLNQFITEIKKPGVYYGQCSEICGPYHGFMPIVIEAVPFDEFKLWAVKKNKAYLELVDGPYRFLNWCVLMTKLYNGDYNSFELWVMEQYNDDVKVPWRTNEEKIKFFKGLKDLHKGPKGPFDDWIYNQLRHVVPWEAIRIKDRIVEFKTYIGLAKMTWIDLFGKYKELKKK